MSSTLERFKNDPGYLVTEAKSIHSNSGRVTILVEGISDLRFFQQWLDEKNARLLSVNGKKVVKSAWMESMRRRADYIVCMVDIDFDDILGDAPITGDRFLYISSAMNPDSSAMECNDLESTLICSGALTKVISQKFALEGIGISLSKKVEEIREALRVASSHVGSLSCAGQLIYRRRKIDAVGHFVIDESYFDPVTIDIDREGMIDFLERGSAVSRDLFDELINTAEDLWKKYSAGWKLCKGHDLTDMLARHLTEMTHMRNRRISRIEVEADLRMACESSMIRETGFGARLLGLHGKYGKSLFRL